MSWRLAHIWLRGYADALNDVHRQQCYTENDGARDTYLRGQLAAYDAEVAHGT